MCINMRICRIKIIIGLLMLLFIFCSCGNNRSDKGISEFEQFKYDYTVKQINDIYAEASDITISGSQFAVSAIRQKIENLNYEFKSDNMSDVNRQKCQALKERVNKLKANPDVVFNGKSFNSSFSVSNDVLINQQNIIIKGVEQFPCWLNQGDTAIIKVNNSVAIQAVLYNYAQRRIIKRWKGNVDDKIITPISGIYVLEINGGEKGIRSHVSVIWKGNGRKLHRNIGTRMVHCKKDDFLSTAIDTLVTENIWEEPKRIALRGHLKTIFSGKSRSLISIPVPVKCDALLYSMRISTNENTVENDGKFSDRLATSYKNIRLLGVKVYEKQSSSDIVNHLLFNTRPPREEDAFCNFYVFTNRAQAKKFQDGKESSGKYKYDVDQSQMGTQSCNGRLNPHGKSMMYMGFENERMRYDNYIWIEVVALRHTIKYIRPIYY